MLKTSYICIVVRECQLGASIRNSELQTSFLVGVSPQRETNIETFHGTVCFLDPAVWDFVNEVIKN